MKAAFISPNLSASGPEKSAPVGGTNPQIEIRHVDVAAAPDILHGEPTSMLLVFWSDDRPVGQLYVTLPLEGVPFADLVGRGVDPVALSGTPKRSATTPRVASVVICTRDRGEHLARCLNSLAGQTTAPHEVIVVDNGSSTDETRLVALLAGVRYLREDRPGLDIARNAGGRAATGEVVVYTDDDVRLHPRWLERMVAAFSDDVDAVTGLVLPTELRSSAQVIFERQWSFGRGFRRMDFGPEYFTKDRGQSCPVWKIGAGASMAFRRDIFERVGFFDERLDAGAAGCSGDSEFWHRILAAGLTVRYEPSAVAFHEHRREMDALARQIFAYARGHAAALLVQHERTGDRRDLKRAWVDLPLYHGRRLVRRILRGSTDADRFLRQEIFGWVSGIWFYYRTPRARALTASR